MTEHIPHWIDGARREASSGRTASVTDPATGQVTGEVALAGVDEVDAAVAAARAAFPAWRDTSLTVRSQVLFAFRELLNARKGELADHHRRARQGPRRRSGRGEPGPGGGRVRLRHPAPAQGRVPGECLDRR